LRVRKNTGANFPDEIGVFHQLLRWMAFVSRKYQSNHFTMMQFHQPQCFSKITIVGHDYRAIIRIKPGVG